MTEHTIHQAIVDYLKLALPPGSVLHHSPNEGNHKVQYRVKQKKLGVRPGWPDLEIFVNPIYFKTKHQCRPIFLEIKTHKGRLSASQDNTLQCLKALGCYCFVVRSIDDTRDALFSFLALGNA